MEAPVVQPLEEQISEQYNRTPALGEICTKSDAVIVASNAKSDQARYTALV
jgi:hypothetical protein